MKFASITVQCNYARQEEGGGPCRIAGHGVHHRHGTGSIVMPCIRNCCAASEREVVPLAGLAAMVLTKGMAAFVECVKMLEVHHMLGTVDPIWHTE
jgi:hypothetical protein